MKAAMPYSILWFAHVLPLYAVRFRLSPSEAMKMLLDMNLASWVNRSDDGKANNSGQSLGELTRKINPAFFQSLHAPGTVFINAYGIPEMPSIKTIYATRFGIPLCSAYSHALRMDQSSLSGCGDCEGDADDDESFMELYMALTHMLASCLQLICAMRDRKIRSCMPSWLDEELMKLFELNNPAVIPSPDPNATQFHLPPPWANIASPAEWDFDFGLKDFASSHITAASLGQKKASSSSGKQDAGGGAGGPGFCTSGISALVCMRIKAAKTDLASMRYKKGRDDVMMVERFTSCLCAGMSMSVMAKNSGMRVTGERRKRKSSDEGEGGGSDGASD